MDDPGSDAADGEMPSPLTPDIRRMRVKETAAVSSTAVERVVSILRETILSSEDGAYLGSEEQLRDKLGVSRPTLRQALRLLQHEHLLVSKRGGAGGLYVRRPQMEAVAHAAAIYLDIEQASTRHIFAASVPLMREAVKLAAGCQDAALHDRLRHLLPPESGGTISACSHDRDHFKIDLEFSELVGQMSGNPVIKLFISIIYRFGWVHWSENLTIRYRDQLEGVGQARDQIIRAILDHDSELAVIYSQRRAEIIFKLIDALG